MIDEYQTGSYMTVEGEKHHQDLKIINDKIKGSWWRKQGHRLDEVDIRDILDAQPAVLVVGTGFAGNMQVPEKTRAVLANRGIRLVAEKTQDAVDAFNRFKESGHDVAGAFHLTC